MLDVEKEPIFDCHWKSDQPNCVEQGTQVLLIVSVFIISFFGVSDIKKISKEEAEFIAMPVVMVSSIII